MIDGDRPTDTSLRRRYLELLKDSVLNVHGAEAEVAYYHAQEAQRAGQGFPEAASFDIAAAAPELVAAVAHARSDGRYVGDDPHRPGFSYTMVGRKRLDQLDALIGDLLADDVPGDLVECGVWRGGASIFMRGVLAAHDITDRTVWVCDSFAGLPPNDHERDPHDLSPGAHPELVVPLERVKQNFRRCGLLDDRVRFIEGYFEETMPTFPAEAEQIALLRLDGDYYASTVSVLDALYDRVPDGGYIVVDDYWLEYCKVAVDEFRDARGIDTPLEMVDWTGAHWRKGG